ncbi:MAG: hypothetical protein K5931_11405 [Lachnospiraceae bacterium]|nr:hypothetical protein [Lachnospiraceae bacterium]
MNNMIKSAIRQDKKRVEYMLESYKAELKSLPKGTISEKRVGNKTYYYLKYRQGSKVISDYISKEDLSGVKEIIERKQHIKTMIRFLKLEKDTADRLLRNKAGNRGLR